MESFTWDSASPRPMFPDDPLRADTKPAAEGAALLPESQDLFHAVWEFSVDAMVLSDREGMVITANPAYCKLYGYSFAEVVGKCFGIIFPEGMRAWALEVYKRTFEAEEIAPAVEAEIMRKDGSTGFVEVRYTFLVERGERVAMLSQIRDVTDSRRAAVLLDAERVRIRTLMEATSEGIFGMDENANCTFINSAAQTYFGYTTEECLGKNMHNLVHYKYPDGTPYPLEDCPLHRTLSDRKAQRLVEETLWHKDGSPLHALYSFSPTLDGDKATGAVVTVIDMGELKKAEEERTQLLASEHEARMVAEQVMHEREQLLSVVSHDLRNPVAIIKSVTQLLQRRITQGRVQEVSQVSPELVKIEAASRRLEDFLRDLLDFSQMQGGASLSLDPVPTDLVALVHTVASSYRQRAEQHRLVVETGALELTGVWDPARIEQVLDNLISNAIKYSPEGGFVKIDLSFDNAPETGRTPVAGSEGGPHAGWAVLSVEDNGLGIPAEDLPHIFDWYRRGSNVIGKINGTGVGLAGASHIVQQHGGTITAQSQEGVGSKFTVRLPLQRAAPGAG